MEKFTIIAGTNRPGSKTKIVARFYEKVFNQYNVKPTFVSLENLSWKFYDPNHYEEAEKVGEIFQIEVLAPTDKYIFILPEYNGSIPGIFKLFIDACDVKKCFHYKKACMVGLGSGRAGNLRGMDDLTGILNYLKVDVYYNKLPLPLIENELDEEGNMLNEETISLVKEQVTGYIKF